MVWARLGAITRLNAFPKPDQDVTRTTVSGGIVTLLGSALATFLFAYELQTFLSPSREYTMAVDTTSRASKLPIHFDITFLSMPCQVLSLNALDGFGRHELDIVSSDILKVRLSREGKPISTERIKDLKHSGIKDQLPRPFNVSKGLVRVDPQLKGESVLSIMDYPKMEAAVKDIVQALTNGEGCRMSGHVKLERIAGVLHVAPHAQHHYILKRVFPGPEAVNMSHKISTLGFGLLYPGILNPLDGFVRVIQGGNGTGHETGNSSLPQIGTFRYYLKVVPTSYKYITGAEVDTNQYSVSEYFHAIDTSNTQELPGLSFVYDLSAITVSIQENRQDFFHFVTRLCAVIGGAIALTGLADRAVYFLIQLILQGRKGRVKRRLY